MSKEQLFWLICIVILNVAAYLVGRRDGRIYGRKNTIDLFNLVAPEEMQAAIKKMNEADPLEVALRANMMERKRNE